MRRGNCRGQAQHRRGYGDLLLPAQISCATTLISVRSYNGTPTPASFDHSVTHTRPVSLGPEVVTKGHEALSVPM